MGSKGFTGISFPFRVGVKGGVAMSSTSPQEVPHIIEAMEQILLTRPNERCMEYDFKSDIDSDIFEPNDASTHTLIAYQVKEALKELEDRIKVNSVEITSEVNIVYAQINFTVLAYDTAYTSTVKVGEMGGTDSNTRDRLYF